MKKYINLNIWNFWMLLLGMGASAGSLAWSSLNLIDLTAANLNFIRTYGIMGLVDGGFLQFMEICLYGLLSLFFYVLFRGFDNEVIDRWRDIGKSDQ